MRPALAFFILCFAYCAQSAETVISYSVLEDTEDKRLEYILAVVDLAMSKTKDKYGDYKIEHIPHFMSLTRSLYELNNNTYSNYFLPGGVNIEQLGAQNLITADYPADQGMLSYRICFVSPAAKEKIAEAKNISDLKKFKIGQGTNWPDVAALEANGFTVVPIDSYVSLFKMVINGRVDMVCRGVAELRKELNTYKKLGELTYDNTFAFHYSMPYRLFFNKNSQAVVDRIQEGLHIAKLDGSLNKLFWAHHHDDLQFAKLNTRKIYYLHYPFEVQTSKEFKSYLIDPLTLANTGQ